MSGIAKCGLAIMLLSMFALILSLIDLPLWVIFLSGVVYGVGEIAFLSGE